MSAAARRKQQLALEKAAKAGGEAGPAALGLDATLTSIATAKLAASDPPVSLVTPDRSFMVLEVDGRNAAGVQVLLPLVAFYWR